MKVQVRMKRGRPKRRWLAGMRDDVKERGLSGEEVYNCLYRYEVLGPGREDCCMEVHIAKH